MNSLWALIPFLIPLIFDLDNKSCIISSDGFPSSKVNGSVAGNSKI